MEMSSCFEGNYKTWGRMIAANGVAVAMVDCRKSVHPSSVPEIAPFPAGPNKPPNLGGLDGWVSVGAGIRTLRCSKNRREDFDGEGALGVAGLPHPVRATVAVLRLTPCENTFQNRTSQTAR
jgi:hypothetical protein